MIKMYNVDISLLINHFIVFMQLLFLVLLKKLKDLFIVLF